MFKIIHRTEIPLGIHTPSFDPSTWRARPAGVANKLADLPPTQLAVVGPVKALIRATGHLKPRTHVRKSQKAIAQPIKFTVDGAEHSINTLEQAQGAVTRLKIKSESLQNQRATY